MKSFAIFEEIERRRLLSAAIVGTTLQIAGTTGDDHISVHIDKTDVSKIDVDLNHKTTQFNLANVKSIRIDGGGGNDDIEIFQSFGTIKLKTLMFGGAGNDTLVGGAEKTVCMEMKAMTRSSANPAAICSMAKMATIRSR